MAHLQYMPGDPRLVDQLVYELKSKGIFDQFRKDCISDVDTRPAYQNLRQRVESSVSLFLSRQTWKPDLNKNQLREKLRKHILDGNYLEQGVERIVDQVVNPKVASVFIPQVEDLVYNYLGIARKKSTPETSNDKGNASTDLLPTDLEAVSPGSVKSNDDKDELMEEPKDDNMEINTDDKPKDLNDISMPSEAELEKEDTQLSGISDLTSHDSETSLGKLSIPMPEAEEINLENIPSPENSPPKIDLDSIEMPKEEEPIELKDIPLPDESPKDEKEQYFKPVNSEDDSSSDSSIIRNMSPLTPIRNFNNENSCDAQQAFENDNDSKDEVKQEPNTFRFTIEAKSTENSCDDIKETKPEKEEQTDLSYQFSEQVNINAFNTPLYDDSSNSHNLQIDYESDVNSKTNLDKIPFPDDPNSEDSKKELTEEKKSHKSSHRSRDSQRHSSSSKDRKSDSKTYNSKDRRDSKTDRKTSKDDQSKSKSSSDKSKDRGDKKESKDGKDNKDSKHRSSSHKSSSSKDSKDSKHRSSSSSQKHSSKTDDKKSSNTTNKDKDKEKDKAADKSLKEHRSSKDSKSRSDKDKKTKKDDKDKKDKKDTDDHYTASGRGNHSRRSTDRDSNDGSSSSKGSQNPSSSKSSESKANKGTSSKSDNTSPSSDATSPSDKGTVTENNTEANMSQSKPVVRVDTHLERPVGTPPRLPFVPDVTLKKPKFAANLAEAKRLMKMRKFLDEEQKRMNQEAALLLEFQANVRPSLSQVYSSIPGPELEFACISNIVEPAKPILETNYAEVQPIEEIGDVPDSIEMELSEMNRETKEIVPTEVPEAIIYEPIEYTADFEDSEKILNEISKKVYGVTDESIEEDYEAEMTEDIISETIKKNEDTELEVIVITEEMIDNEAVKETVEPKYEIDETVQNNERPLEYFAESEKFDAELERAKFENFLKEYLTTTITDKLYLINCNSYEENIMKEVAETFGHFEIINYHKNGFKNKNVVKNVNVSNEIVLPLDRNSPVEVNVLKSTQISPIFSPVKSECSFELSSDYDARLEEMVNKTSRQEIMEIILGGSVPDESPSKMPKIDYCMDDHFERDEDLKRKMSVESLDNNNEHVLTPNKMRKLSDSDQISSTTEETPVNVNLSKTNSVRSKYLGKARRVGLSRPRRTVQPNSPSSDKSVENYDTSGSPAPNGKLKSQRKVQRYDTSDLYKPKLHYLSRRNNIS